MQSECEMSYLGIVHLLILEKYVYLRKSVSVSVVFALQVHNLAYFYISQRNSSSGYHLPLKVAPMFQCVFHPKPYLKLSDGFCLFKDQSQD